MQDIWEQNDLELRSMLESAEVKAPSRVWRAVSSRLDAAAVSSRSAAAWWWGLSMAAAALAVALVLPFVNRSAGDGSDAVQLIQSQQAPLAEVLAPAAEDEAISVEPVSENQIQPIERTIRAERVNAEQLTAESAPVTQDDAPVMASEPAGMQPDATVENSNAVSASPERADLGMTTGTQDYWAAVEREENAPRGRSRRPSFYADGLVATNDSEFAANHGKSLMSPSYGKPQVVDGLTETSASTYGIPFSVGVGARLYLMDRLSVSLGLSYSLLTRSFTGDYAEGGSVVKGDVMHQMQYVGIPLNLFYDIISADTNPVRFYAYAGASVEQAVSNTYQIRSAQKTISQSVDKLNYSLGAGLGVEFRITDHLGLYVDPGVRYYFYNGQPKSLRTEKPFMVSFDAGLRFNL